MKRAYIIYSLYILFFVLLVGSIVLTPYLAFKQDMNFSYTAFSYTCHQKLSRSLCLFSDGKSYYIADCTPQSGVFITDEADRTQIKVQNGAFTGYKMPVCSRDVGLYVAMLVGGLLYPLFRRIDDTNIFPAIYLVLAIVPLGVDGTLQLVSEFGILPFVYESTNAVRLFTGVLAGLAAAVYAIPILMNMFSVDDEKSDAKAKKTAKKK